MLHIKFISGEGEVDRFGGRVWDEYVVVDDNGEMVCEGFVSQADAQAFVDKRENKESK